MISLDSLSLRRGVKQCWSSVSTVFTVENDNTAAFSGIVEEIGF